MTCQQLLPSRVVVVSGGSSGRNTNRRSTNPRQLLCTVVVLLYICSGVVSASSLSSTTHNFLVNTFNADSSTNLDHPAFQSATTVPQESFPSSSSSAVILHPQYSPAVVNRRRPLLPLKLPTLPTLTFTKHIIPIPSKSAFMSAIAFNTQKTIKLAVYFFFLYFFTVVYNVANKKVVEYLPLPASVAALQTLIGIPMFLPLWLLKPPRNFEAMDRNSLMKIALCHGLGNLATVYALQSGSVSFTHVVKSAEPLFTALLSIVIMKSSLPLPVYMSLIPIVVGVGLASVKEMSFTWFGFFAAMASNLFYQLRMVLSKVLFNGSDDNPHTKLSAANTFRVITIFSFMQLVPIALILEGHQIPMAIQHLLAQPGELRMALLNLLISGMSFYLYNEIGFWILDLVHPVSHAVGNTIKRVVLVFASILIFHNPVNSLGMTGSAIAILGSFLYAIASQKPGISPSASSSALPLTTVNK